MICTITADNIIITADQLTPTADAIYCYYKKVFNPEFSVGQTQSITVTTSESSLVCVTYGDEILIDHETIDESYTIDFVVEEGDQDITILYETTVYGTITTTLKYPNYHNLLNNGAGVMRFKEGFDGWASYNSFVPEGMTLLDDDLYSFKDGYLHKHNGNKGEFYGVKNDSVIGFRAADVKGVIKILKYLVIESNVKPKFINVQANNGYLQQTSLCPVDMVYREGDYFASFLFDMLSPNVTGATQQEQWYKGLTTGDEMRASYFDIFMVFDNDDDFVLSSVSIGMINSTGHRSN